MSPTDRYVIAWRSNLTGCMGRGQTTFSLAEAKRLCASLNKTLPFAHHWPDRAETQGAWTCREKTSDPDCRASGS